jgi:hypothetical protein
MKKEIVKKKIDNSLHIVNQEIDKHIQGTGGMGSLETLEEIKDELLNMGKTLTPKLYMPTYDYILRDDMWSYMTISESLLDTYYLYMKLD